MLDFLLIGAPNSGAEELGELLRGHPQVALPVEPEPPIFVTGSHYALGPEWFEPGCFERHGAGVLRGLVDPGHMSGMIHGRAVGSIEILVAGLVRTLPDARLIAVLRGPLERACAQHRLATRRGRERRPLETALRAGLATGAIRAARLRPRETTSYIAASEYGRILAAYRKHYASAQLLVLVADEVEQDPGGAIGRISEFLGIDNAWRPPAPPSAEVSRSGDGPISREETSDLIEALRTELPRVKAGSIERAVQAWSRSSDVARLPADLAQSLEAHFAADAIRLEEACGVRVPWSADAISSVRFPVADSHPDVSIVILVHETPGELRALLDSIVRHTQGTYETVVIDNGSGPVAREAIAALAQTYASLGGPA